ncbi:MAG: TdeIII family type II restriction endonuclease [Bacteroidales bacterium]|jgi:hypothetical protein|nr:TdeIII family type II restriction endonuclease [Bacteroidales bacterium]
MALTNEIKEKISIEVIRVMIAASEFVPANDCNNYNNPFLHAFADKLENNVSDVPYFISLASWLHGLNTTFGQAFFENVAHILCNGEKREYTSKKLGNLPITKEQQETITQIINDLSTSSKKPNLEAANRKLLQKDDSEKVKAEDFSADVFFENNDSVVAIELKTVKPNSGGMKGEKQKILEGKAALFHLFPNKQIYFFFGFPFDPTVNPENESVTSYNKTRFLNSIVNAHKFCAQNEFLVASELWDFLSGKENTTEDILLIINKIATTDFLQKMQLLKDNSKRNLAEYLSQLEDWNLFSEKELIINNNLIISQLTNNNLVRTYNKIAFNKEGYNWDRYNTLKSLL